MPLQKGFDKPVKISKRPPPKTLEELERNMSELAYKAVEKRLSEGTASAQEYVYWLRQGSSREQDERERLKVELRLAEEKINALKAEQRDSEMFAKAMQAITQYRGGPQDEEEFD